MGDTMIADIAIILFGVLAVVFRGSIVKQKDGVNRRIFRMKSSPAQLKQSDTIVLILGIALIVFGMLSLLNIL